MELLTTLASVRGVFSQDVARHNAASAAEQLMRRRRQRAEVEEYLAQLDRRNANPGSAAPDDNGSVRRASVS